MSELRGLRSLSMSLHPIGVWAFVLEVLEEPVRWLSS